MLELPHKVLNNKYVVTAKRSKEKITLDILSAASNGAKITDLHKAYGDYSRLKEYIASLKNDGILEEIKEDNKLLYRTTDKGIKFLNKSKDYRKNI